MAIVVIALLVYLVPPLLNTRLTFTVEDAVSHSWVWDATVKLENREMKLYYQSDKGTVPLTFTHLAPGKATLEVSAPNYVTQKIPVDLHLGKNLLSKPVELVGYQIPDLAHFTMFESTDGSNIHIQIRPVSAQGPAVTNHPCLDLWIGALVSAEVRNGQPVTSPSQAGARRGQTLYKGRIPWSWDSSLNATFRYSATIPFSSLASQSAPYLVIDYLVIVPDPRKITSKEIDAMMSSAPDFTKPEQLVQYLKANQGDGRYRYFLTTSWNVKGPGAGA